MHLAPRLILRFIITLLLLLVVTFVLWWAIAPELMAPMFWLADPLLDMLLPEAYHQLQQQGTEGLIFSIWGEEGGQLLPAAQVGHHLAFAFNTGIVSCSLPFFIALTLATPGRIWVGQLLVGCLTLYLAAFIGFMVLAIKSLMVGIGMLAFSGAGMGWLLNPNSIGLLYQMSTLLVPFLLPVVIWAIQQRAKWSQILASQIANNQDAPGC